jgi:anti-sigma-K factor RskA
VNIQEYISSGIVESYVLGLASNEEQLEFEQLCATNAELRQAREAFELSLEQHALDNAVAPPAALKQKTWNDINLDINTAAPVVNMKKAENNTQPLTPVRSVSFAKLLAAASVILLVGSTLLNFYFYNQYKSSAARLDELIASNQQLADNKRVIEAKLLEYDRSFSMIKDTNMAVIAMKGQPVAPQSLTTVYWNKQTKDVYLLVNALPQPAAGKQYQLWAIVDGKPVDAGLLKPDATDGLVKMSNIPKAQAFAITLENMGGSKTTPTMPIYVVGKS